MSDECSEIPSGQFYSFYDIVSFELRNRVTFEVIFKDKICFVGYLVLKLSACVWVTSKKVP